MSTETFCWKHRE